MKAVFWVCMLVVFSCQMSFAQVTFRKNHYNLDNNLAIQGYDPVVYFSKNKAEKGSDKYTATVDGSVYYFVNDANKVTFLKNTKKYEPQFGGWCAYAMGATNTKVEIDPETFKIIDGKLYLFFHNWVNNTLLKWNKDEAKFLSKANENWKVKTLGK